MARLKLKPQFRGVTLTRQVVGFGQKRFILSEMNAEQVEKWADRGVDLSEYFEADKGKEDDESHDGEVEKRFKERATGLLENGFKRVKGDFKNKETGVSISDVDVRDLSDEDYDTQINAEAEK